MTNSTTPTTQQGTPLWQATRQLHTRQKDETRRGEVVSQPTHLIRLLDAGREEWEVKGKCELR